MEQKLTHFDENGNAVMVDVSEKKVTKRTAVARGCIKVNDEVFQRILEGSVEKGDVLGVARVAGIMGVKRTSDLIPLCHPLMLSKSSIHFQLDEEAKVITAECLCTLEGKTGVEMEALTGVTIALLTIYDMCKALDKEMEIFGVHLIKKTGGKSGEYERPI